MRVLQVDSGREWRGGQQQVLLLCRELSRNTAVEQVLVTKQGGELARRAAADGITVQGVASDPLAAVGAGVGAGELRRSAVPPLDIRSDLRLPASVPLAVNAAALVDHKDHRTLIRAAEYARSVEPQLHWIIAGEGALRASLAAEIARLELQDRVHLVGFVERINALIAAADVFVMSSKLEGLGSVILNALALGRPIVATAAGGIPEILPAEVLVPVGAADALAQKVLETLRPPHPAPLPFPPRFTANAMAQGVLDVYRALL